MHNTEANHALLRLGLIQNMLLRYQVRITLRLVAFPEKQIDALERKHVSGLPDSALIDLWEKGNGTTLTSQTVKTLNGVNAILECVEEIIYPTEMDVEDDPRTEKKEGGAVIYGGFETRDVGVILNATPTVGQDLNTINLVLLPEKADLKGANDLQPEVAKPMTPTFHSLNVTTSVVLENQATLVLGQTTDPVSGQRIVLLVGAGLIDTKGEPITIPRIAPTPEELKREEP
jgi:hypothetical protein